MDDPNADQPSADADFQPVPAALIRNKIGHLHGPVTTRQLVDHLAGNGATPDEIATVAALPDREWTDYNQALAAASSGFEQRHQRRTATTVSDHDERTQ